MEYSEREEFRGFCHNATDSQLIDIFKQESGYTGDHTSNQYRLICAEIARGVATTRGLEEEILEVIAEFEEDSE